MKFSFAATCISLGLFFTAMASAQGYALDPNDNVQSWSSAYQNEMDTEVRTRSRRGVDLKTLRQLMNNIAFSEYYRLRGLELLGNLGMGHGRPSGVPANPVGLTAHNGLSVMTVPNNALMAALASSPIASVVAPPSTQSDAPSPVVVPSASSGGGSRKNGVFSFPLRSDEFHQFFGTLARMSNSRRG